MATQSLFPNPESRVPSPQSRLPTPDSLSSEQRAVVAARAGVWRCLAGPGAGKTRCLVERAQALRAEGAAPEDILALTFTNRAAAEMRQRAGWPKLTTTSRPCGFMTFHALALRFAFLERSAFPFQLAEVPIAPVTKTRRFLKLAAAKLPSLPGAAKLDAGLLASWISLQKRHGILPAQAQQSALDPYHRNLARAYADYEQQCVREGLLDFDSLVLGMQRILSARPDILERWSYPWLMADEMQDSDALQLHLLRLLSQQSGNLFCVGDANQSIFAWRGAAPEVLTQLEASFPQVRTLYLSCNYRSTKSIVEHVKSILPEDVLARQLHTENAAGEPPVVTAYPSEYAEAEGVVGRLVGSRSLTAAVLARTNRYLGLFEALLGERRVKYHLLGHSGFWEQPEVKHLLMRLRGAPSLHSLTASEAVSRLVEELAPDAAADPDNDPEENLRNLAKLAGRFPDVPAFLAYANRAAHAAKKTVGVALGTIHSAKGLEWDDVYVVGVEEGLLPHKRAELPEEEARLWYVACSRAASRLFISYTGVPSSFLRSLTGSTVSVV